MYKQSSRGPGQVSVGATGARPRLEQPRSAVRRGVGHVGTGRRNPGGTRRCSLWGSAVFAPPSQLPTIARACFAGGIRWPGDISIVSLGNRAFVPQLDRRPFTFVTIPIGRVGRGAAQLLSSMIRGSGSRPGRSTSSTARARCRSRMSAAALLRLHLNGPPTPMRARSPRVAPLLTLSAVSRATGTR